MRQKRPKIQPLYKMRPKNMTEFDIAMQDLKEIFYLIEKI
jgi:hypothetical protein